MTQDATKDAKRSAESGAAPLADLEREMAEIGRRAEQVREEMVALRPSATSSDGAVTVTVTATGVLAGLTFGQAAAEHPLSELASLVLRTARDAHRIGAIRTQQALAPLVGADSAALEFMRDFVPDDDDARDDAAGATAAAPAPDDAIDRSVPVSPAASVSPAAPPADDDEGFTGRGAR